MKTIYKTSIQILLVFSIVFSIISCSDDFLEITPNGVLVAQTTEDYNLLLNGNGLWLNIAAGNREVLRSFEVCGLEPFFSNAYGEAAFSRNNFTWEPGVVDPESERGQFSDWLMLYMQRIYIYNKVINEVLDSAGGSDAEKKSIQAEARAARAAVYFELVNFYGKPYNTSTASSDLGVPIVTEADVTVVSFTRASVQEVYDFIIEDLNTAIPTLPIGVTEKPRMSKGAAEALLGKVYIYQNKFTAAIPLLDAALNDLQAGTEVRLYDYNVSTLPGGVHAAGFFGPPFETPVDNLEVAFTMSINHPAGFTRSNVLLSPEVSALYGTSDFRLNHFFSRKPFPPVGPDFVVPGVYRKLGSLVAERGVRIPDIYLLRAECKARTNDLSGAITDLEFLRTHRMNPVDAPVSAGLSQDDLIKYVFEERTREFASEGELWFDMRRLWDDPLFQDKKPYIHTLYDVDGSVKETYTLTEDRLVLRFGPGVLEDNPDLVDNP
ncbi:MAG: RagB/SusD family nutrient uptake outer membrane protein [Bacteroidota bacterium]